MKLLPTPKQCVPETGAFSLKNAVVLVAAGTDRRVVRAAEELRRAFESAANTFIRFAVTQTVPERGTILIRHDLDASAEGYTLTIRENGIVVDAKGPAGAFYGIQTLRQLVRVHGDMLPALTIEDAPSFAERGLYHDVSRGRVPTLQNLKEIADQLAELKYNQLQLYVEDTFWNEEYASFRPKDCCLTAEELLELDAYCADRFIELVPSLSTFGHLYNLLENERYRHLCEYEDWEPKQHYWMEKMAHHTLDAYDPKSFALVRQMIEEYLPLFSSKKFNICCDETFDLCKGKNAGKDEGEAYYQFVKQIIDLVRGYGKTVQMWGDIVLHHTEKLASLPQDVVMLNWSYSREPRRDWVETFAKNRLPQLVCSGTTAWDHWAADLDIATENIRKFAAYGAEFGVNGMLTTNWGDYGAICSYNSALYTIVYGAEQSWNPGLDERGAFNEAIDALFFGEEGTAAKLWELTWAEKAAPWYELVWWVSAKTIEQKEKELPCTADTEKAVQTAAALAEEWKAKQNPLFNDLAAAADGISLTARTFLYLTGTKDDTLAADWDRFLDDYAVCWRRDNKESELWRIRDFVHETLTLA